MNRQAYEVGARTALMEKLAINPSTAEALALLVGRPLKWGGMGALLGAGGAGIGALIGDDPNPTGRHILQHLGKGALMGSLTGLGAAGGSALGHYGGKGVSALLGNAGGELGAVLPQEILRRAGAIGGGLAALGPAVGAATGTKLPNRAEVRKMMEAEQAGEYIPGEPWPPEA
jgi:hypothetical protein